MFNRNFRTGSCRLATLFVVVMLVMTHSTQLFACAVCQGDPNSKLVIGAKAGVLFMMILTYGLLIGMVGIGATFFVRNRRRHLSVGQDESADDASGTE